jgi:hypothetical protein
MSTTNSKIKSLIKLRYFCANPPYGMVSHWWFNGLVNAYPLDFLFYTQFFNKFPGTKKVAKERILSRFQKKIELLLDYPITEKQISLIERIWTEFDELNIESKQINKN